MNFPKAKWLLLAVTLLAWWFSGQGSFLSAQDSSSQDLLDIKLVEQIGGLISTVAVEDDYAYVGVGPRLVVLDISDPSNPQFIGQSPVLSAGANDIAISNSTAYIAVYEMGLLIVDVSDPITPMEIGKLITSGEPRIIEVIDEIVLITDDEGRLHIFDAENPANIREMAILDIESLIRRMTVAGEIAYLADRDGYGVLGVKGRFCTLRGDQNILFRPKIPNIHDASQAKCFAQASIP